MVTALDRYRRRGCGGREWWMSLLHTYEVRSRDAGIMEKPCCVVGQLKLVVRAHVRAGVALSGALNLRPSICWSSQSKDNTKYHNRAITTSFRKEQRAKQAAPQCPHRSRRAHPSPLPPEGFRQNKHLTVTIHPPSPMHGAHAALH